MKLLKNVFKDSDVEVYIITLSPEQEKCFKSQIENKRFKAATAKKSKLVFLGDSHIKGIHNPMKKLTPESMDVEIYPDGGANTSQILNDLNLVSSSLEVDDYLIVMSGTNDMSFTNNGKCTNLNLHEEARKDLFSQARHTNVLVVSVPHRFDKAKVNEHIDKYNDSLGNPICNLF